MVRRIWILGLFAALLAVLPTVPAHAQGGPRHFLSVVGDNGEAVTGGRCRVHGVGLQTDLTIYANQTLATTKVNPTALSSTGQCDWYLAAATDAVDVVVYIDSGPYKGARVRVDNLTRGGQKKVTVTRASPSKTVTVPFTQNTSTQTTVFTLPAGALVTHAIAEVRTNVAASTVTVGETGGTTTSICNAASAATAGFVSCAPTAFTVATTRTITYSTSNHAINGYIHVYYVEAGNE